MVSKMRAQRIADRIREELSVMLVNDIADPRIAHISITDVKVDRELAFAEIFYSSLEGSDRADEILEGLLHAKGFIRRELAHRVDLRTFPALRFCYDPTFERAERMEELFRSLKEEAASDKQSLDSDSGSSKDCLDVN